MKKMHDRAHLFCRAKLQKVEQNAMRQMLYGFISTVYRCDTSLGKRSTGRAPCPIHIRTLESAGFLLHRKCPPEYDVEPLEQSQIDAAAAVFETARQEPRQNTS